jgi:hypothetical protein
MSALLADAPRALDSDWGVSLSGYAEPGANSLC